MNDNLMAHEDPSNQEMDDDESMANQNQDENDEFKTNEITNITMKINKIKTIP